MPALAKHISFSREPLTVGHHKKDIFLLSRIIHHTGEEELNLISGTGDTTFSGKPHKVYLKLGNGKDEDIKKCHHFKFFCNEGDVTLTYMRDERVRNHTSSSNSSPSNPSTLIYAGTKDRKTWVVGGTVKEVTSPGILIPELEDDAGDVVYFEHADLMKAAVSKNLKTWKTVLPARVPHWHFFEGQPFHIMGAIAVEDGIAVFFESTIKVDILKDVGFQDHKIGEERFVKIGAALFSREDTTKLIWQTELPLAELPFSEIVFDDTKGADHGHGNQDHKENTFTFLGVVPSRAIGQTLERETTARFYVAAQAKVGFFEFPAGILHDHRRRTPAALKKSPKNPILEPTHRAWESGGAFNPAAVKVDDKVHLLYRAVGNDSWSRIGHASSKDGVHFDERSKRPVYSPHEWFESPADRVDADRADGEKESAESSVKNEHDHTLFASGGSWGGCEDPKTTLIGDRIYMTYVAHNGTWPQRSALTSISVEDFKNKKWKWSKSMLMSPPGVGSKSAVILPEKIEGKFLLFHRMWPNIMIDLVPELEFGEGKGGKPARWLTGQHSIRPRSSYWDSRKMSVGATPIKTDAGWLTIYNAVDKRDSSKYKIGAMLLDRNDPRKVIARSRRPILSPDEWYENNGKPGIAYPGGAVDLDGTLHVYYGGGDLVSCVATIGTEEMVWHLLKDRDPSFKLVRVGVPSKNTPLELGQEPELELDSVFNFKKLFS